MTSLALFYIALFRAVYYVPISLVTFKLSVVTLLVSVLYRLFFNVVSRLQDPNYDLKIRRTTGIPKSFLRPAEKPGQKGALLVPETGEHAVPIVDQ